MKLPHGLEPTENSPRGSSGTTVRPSANRRRSMSPRRPEYLRTTTTRGEGRALPPDVANGTVTRVKPLRVANRARYERHGDGSRLR